MANFSQHLLIEKILAYLRLKAARNKDSGDTYEAALPFQNTAGICSGLVSYWLYNVRMGTLSKFKRQMNRLLNCKLEDLKADSKFHFQDPDIEDFLNNVLFLHHDNNLRTDLERHNMDQSFALLLDDLLPQVAPAEFSISFVFNKPKLTKLITDYVQPDKMIRFGNGFHTVGALLKDGVYYFYNPYADEGPVVLNSAEELATELFKALGAFCKSKTSIALNMSIFDLEGRAPGEYPPNVVDFCREQMQDAKYKKTVLSHPNILRLCLKYEWDTDPTRESMLEMLFAKGYKYVESNNYITTELGEVAAEQNEAKIKYLLAHGVDIDYKPKTGENALATAIRADVNNMVYFLLEQGAAPSIPASDKISALQYALVWRDTEAIIILLAVGAPFDASFLTALERKYTAEDVAAIKQQAIELNAKLLHLPEDHNFSSLVDHAHLKAQLGYADGQLELNNKSSKEIMGLIDHVVQEIKTKDANQYTDDELMRIASIVDQLTDLSSMSSYLYPSKMRLGYKAAAAKQEIADYLAQNQTATRTAPVRTANLLLFSNAQQGQNQELGYEGVKRYLALKL